MSSILYAESNILTAISWGSGVGYVTLGTLLLSLQWLLVSILGNPKSYKMQIPQKDFSHRKYWMTELLMLHFSEDVTVRKDLLLDCMRLKTKIEKTRDNNAASQDC